MSDLVEKKLGDVQVSVTEAAGQIKLAATGSILGGDILISASVTVNGPKLLSDEALKQQNPAVQKALQFLSAIVGKLPG